MSLAERADSGIAIGAWGAVQATAAGVAIALGGAIRDIVSTLAANGALGAAISSPESGYTVVVLSNSDNDCRQILDFLRSDPPEQ